MPKLFPSGIAEGKTFCNRIAEKNHLMRNIQTMQHTLIISPRRYGKTSLIFETLKQANIPYAYTQFFNAFRDEVVVKRFLEVISDLLSLIIKPSQRALRKLGQFFTHGKLMLKIQGVEAKFGIEPIIEDPIHIIQNMLRDIEQILKNEKKTAVIFLDEFQDIVNSDLSEELQSILRDFIQQTRYITFIMSGSNRHMLTKIFNHRSKPFYKLFEKILLNRIEKIHYEKFLQKLSIEQWNKSLDNDVLQIIFQLTENHAYYLNRICQKLWALNQIPSVTEVEQSWKNLSYEEFDTVAMELSTLTKNQRILLQILSRHRGVLEPASTSFLSEVKLSHRSVKIALDALIKLDLIERTVQGYQMIDPMMKYILSR